MNQVLENIHNRRSVRLFDSKPIPKKLMQEIINAGHAAPSAMNAQEWRFVVVQSADMRRKFTAVALPKYKAWLATAPEAVKTARSSIDKKVKDPVYYSAAAVVFVIGHGLSKEMDCPMVCQNMMLAAHSLGIGSCWVFMGQLVLTDDEVKKVLKITDNEKVFGPIIFGYPKDFIFPPPPQKRPVFVTWA